jgi:hypothetical protein
MAICIENRMGQYYWSSLLVVIHGYREHLTEASLFAFTLNFSPKQAEEFILIPLLFYALTTLSKPVLQERSTI